MQLKCKRGEELCPKDLKSEQKLSRKCPKAGKKCKLAGREEITIEKAWRSSLARRVSTFA